MWKQNRCIELSTNPFYLVNEAAEVKKSETTSTKSSRTKFQCEANVNKTKVFATKKHDTIFTLF